MPNGWPQQQLPVPVAVPAPQPATQVPVPVPVGLAAAAASNLSDDEDVGAAAAAAPTGNTSGRDAYVHVSNNRVTKDLDATLGRELVSTVPAPVFVGVRIMRNPVL